MCGRKPPKGLRNCRRCIRSRNPIGRPRTFTPKVKAKNQADHYDRYRQKHRCVDCGVKVAFDEDLKRYPARCLTHRAENAARKREAAYNLEREKMAAGDMPARLHDLEQTGDLDVEELVVVDDDSMRNPRRERDLRRGTPKVTFED